MAIKISDLELTELTNEEAQSIKGSAGGKGKLAQWGIEFTRDYIIGKAIDLTIEHAPAAYEATKRTSYNVYTDIRDNYNHMNNPQNWVNGDYDFLYRR